MNLGHLMIEDGQREYSEQKLARCLFALVFTKRDTKDSPIPKLIL